ncbi:MAG: MFS transporter [Ktedonobacterales bacterium]|nr:MFS transporter [Ktedonobacterales bacterium]
MSQTLIAPPPTSNSSVAAPSPPMGRSHSLWQNAAFCRLWAGETISLFGTEITVIALPFTAILALQATAFEIGLLDALAWLPYLLFSLAFGVWVDQRRRRPLIVWTNLARAGLLAMIPLAWFTHQLSFPLLYCVAFAAGVCAVIFNLAYQAYVGVILAPEHIVSGNSKLQISASSAKIAGPGIAGLLVQFLTAPCAIAIDAVSFAVAGLSTMATPAHEPLPPPLEERRPLLHEIRSGLTYTFRHTHLRALTAMSGIYNLAEQIILTLWLLYAHHHGVAPVWMGAILAMGSCGALLGAVLSATLLQRWRIQTALRLAISISVAGLLCIPLAVGTPTSISLILALAFGLNGFGQALLNVLLRSIRQQTIPPVMMGRVLASYTCFAVGTVPLGALLAGILSLALGIYGTLIVGSLIALAAIPWIWHIRIPGEGVARRSTVPQRYQPGHTTSAIRIVRPVARVFRTRSAGWARHLTHWTGQFTQRLIKEGGILMGFLRYDVPAAIIPPLLFILAALPVPHQHPLVTWGFALGYFICFGLCFTIANQIAGIAEDAINKPDRPLVRGLLSVRGAWVRWSIIVGVFIGLGLVAHILTFSALWIVISLTSALGWDRSPWWKNGVMGLGVMAELGSVWQIAQPLTMTAARWIVALAVIVTLVISIQDLRDISGDRARDRHTLPIMWGEAAVRRILLAAFIFLPIAFHLLLTASFPPSSLRFVIELALATLAWLIGWRLIAQRGKRADHITYLIFTGWYCMALAGFATLTHFG